MTITTVKVGDNGTVAIPVGTQWRISIQRLTLFANNPRSNKATLKIGNVKLSSESDSASNDQLAEYGKISAALVSNYSTGANQINEANLKKILDEIPAAYDANIFKLKDNCTIDLVDLVSKLKAKNYFTQAGMPGITILKDVLNGMGALKVASSGGGSGSGSTTPYFKFSDKTPKVSSGDHRPMEVNYRLFSLTEGSGDSFNMATPKYDYPINNNSSASNNTIGLGGVFNFGFNILPNNPDDKVKFRATADIGGNWQQIPKNITGKPEYYNVGNAKLDIKAMISYYSGIFTARGNFSLLNMDMLTMNALTGKDDVTAKWAGPLSQYAFDFGLYKKGTFFTTLGFFGNIPYKDNNSENRSFVEGVEKGNCWMKFEPGIIFNDKNNNFSSALSLYWTSALSQPGTENAFENNIIGLLFNSQNRCRVNIETYQNYETAFFDLNKGTQLRTDKNWDLDASVALVNINPIKWIIGWTSPDVKKFCDKFYFDYEVSAKHIFWYAKNWNNRPPIDHVISLNIPTGVLGMKFTGKMNIHQASKPKGEPVDYNVVPLPATANLDLIGYVEYDQLGGSFQSKGTIPPIKIEMEKDENGNVKPITGYNPGNDGTRPVITINADAYYMERTYGASPSYPGRTAFDANVDITSWGRTTDVNNVIYVKSVTIKDPLGRTSTIVNNYTPGTVYLNKATPLSIVIPPGFYSKNMLAYEVIIEVGITPTSITKTDSVLNRGLNGWIMDPYHDNQWIDDTAGTVDPAYGEGDTDGINDEDWDPFADFAPPAVAKFIPNVSVKITH